MQTTRLLIEHPPVELLYQRDGHTRVWEIVREVETTHSDGRKSVDAVKSHIHEKGSGLCYMDSSGGYVPSIAEWREVPDGFVIDRCGYWLSVGKAIGSGLRYTFEGNELLLRAAYLMISDGVNQAPVGVLNPNTTGLIVAGSPSVVRFPSAFGPGYDLEYVAEKDGFHQNLIISARPRLPLGFGPNSSRLEVWTEVGLDTYLARSGAEVVIGGSCSPDIAGLAGVEAEPGTPIEFVAKGEGKDGAGAGGGEVLWLFADSEVKDSSDPPAPVSRTAAIREIRRDAESGQVHLVEKVAFDYLAQASYPVTWDYVVKSGTIGSKVIEEWTPNNTYYVSGTLNIYGRVTIVPGTVVKIAPSVGINVMGTQPFTARGEPWDYIVFTNAQDDTCGEPIVNPPAGRYNIGLKLYSGSSAQSVIQYCKLGHGTTAIQCYKSLNSPVANNIIRDMSYAGIMVYSSSTHCRNNLVVGAPGAWTGIYAGSPAGYLELTNNTIDSCQYGVYCYNCTGITAKYNVVTRNSTGMYSNNPYLRIQYNGFWNNSVRNTGGAYGGGNVDLGGDPQSNPYDPSPVGDLFLNSEAPGGGSFQDAADIQASEVGLGSVEFAVLRPGTAPTSVTANEYWLKLPTDAGSLDFGYHHNRVDWVLDDADTTVSGAGLVLVPGLVVAVNGPGRSLRVGTEGKLICPGNPYEHPPNVIASKRSVSMGIESSLKLYPQYAKNESQVGITLCADSIFDSRIRNTVFRGLHWGIKAERWCLFPIKNCRFDQNIIGTESCGGAVSAVNSVFAWNETGIGAELPAGARAEFRNNTFDGNWWEGLHLNTVAGSTAVVRDNLFTSNNRGIQFYGDGEIERGYNGFYGNQQDQTGGPNEGDQFLGSSPYHKEGVVTKRWFLNQGCALINAGSRTTLAARLLPYTTAYDQSYDVGKIDIGYHALTATGSANPDPDAAQLTITRIMDEYGYTPAESWLTGDVDVTVKTIEGDAYSCEDVHVYVDGEYAGRVAAISGLPTGAPEAADHTLGLDSTALPNGLHTVQALAQNLKPAIGRCEPIGFETFNLTHCMSVSARECNFAEGDTVELSGLLVEPLPYKVRVNMCAGFDPPQNPNEQPIWYVYELKWLGPRPASQVVHEAWDGTLSPTLIGDGLINLDTWVQILGQWLQSDSWVSVAAFSRPISETEVAIFLPEFFRWDVASAQAVISACWNLNLPYRVFVDQSANWDNLCNFISEGTPYLIYISSHGDWQETICCETYTVTCFGLSDGYVYADMLAPEGPLPESFVSCHNFISTLKDPWGYWLSESGWVKFVWVDACYGGKIPSGCNMNDMAWAFGMDSDNNREGFGDQSYIGFDNLQAGGSWYDGWISAMYNWLFWYYLSLWNGQDPEPYYGVKQAWELTRDQITEWKAAEYYWAWALDWCLGHNTYSEPSSGAKLKCHPY